ncbi:alpha/beta fold hydrolase [Nocardiopsis sp. LOL_012]|uniref:alpha/beta fold hydrolase n=1 Tax=Nocardiopsis sp. LOL_012 TaxID=3345409 RepID=UPI003A878447
MPVLLPSVVSAHVDTDRLRTHVLHLDRGGEPVVFVHGLLASSVFWQRTMLALPERYRPVALDLRGFGDTERAPIDGARGLEDFCDDVVALLDALGLERVHLVGWSMGGAVSATVLRRAPERVRSLTVVNPVSPYGFGGTHGADGELNHPSGAGSGGGCADPGFAARIAEGDRSDDSPSSPRQVLTTTYVAPGWQPEDPSDVEMYVDSVLASAVGEDHYPGDVATTEAWPGVAPGRKGVLNALSPLHMRWDDLPRIDPKPPVRWIRGTHDAVISDTSMFDTAHLGSLGAVPGWPGADAAPAQPMVAQTRAVLEAYAAAGGSYEEHVIECGHTPQIERPEEFMAALLPHLEAAER